MELLQNWFYFRNAEATANARMRPDKCEQGRLRRVSCGPGATALLVLGVWDAHASAE